MSEKEKLNNLLSARIEFAKAKQEYKDTIYKFLGDAAKYIDIIFDRNKMYLIFESVCPFDDKYLLKFCNEFGFLAPICEFEELSEYTTIYK